MAVSRLPAVFDYPADDGSPGVVGDVGDHDLGAISGGDLVFSAYASTNEFVFPRILSLYVRAVAAPMPCPLPVITKT